MLLSRNSRADIKVFTLPSPFSKPAAVLLETAFERFQLPTLPTGCGIFRRQLLQVVADESRQSGSAIDRKFAQFFDEFVIERKSDIHVHIIRDSLNPCNKNRGDVVLASPRSCSETCQQRHRTYCPANP